MEFVNIKFSGNLQGWRIGLKIFGQLWCLERSTVWVGPVKYLTRNIIYAFGGTLRLHKFWRGDDDRASHTHPWNFWTFPLANYLEQRFNHGGCIGTYRVQAWRWHARSCFHEHIVLGREKAHLDFSFEPLDPRPFYTIVVTGPKINEWGFYPEPNKFIHWRSYEPAP